MIDRGTTGDASDQRRAWLAVLARAEREALEMTVHEQGVHECTVVRPAEIGMVMLRGRVGGSGEPFNVGEATVTRCAVQTRSGIVGIGYVLGRDRRKAELVAVLDAWLQDTGPGDERVQRVIGPLAATQSAERERVRGAASSSKVEFFTLERGEA